MYTIRFLCKKIIKTESKHHLWCSIGAKPAVSNETRRTTQSTIVHTRQWHFSLTRFNFRLIFLEILPRVSWCGCCSFIFGWKVRAKDCTLPTNHFESIVNSTQQHVGKMRLMELPFTQQRAIQTASSIRKQHLSNIYNALRLWMILCWLCIVASTIALATIQATSADATEFGYCFGGCCCCCFWCRWL